MANLKIVESEGLVQRAAEMGNRLLEGLHTLEELDGVGNVRGLGMMAAVEMVEDKTTKAPYPPAAKVGPRLHKEMLRHGFYTRVRGDSVCIAPPLVTSPEQIDRIVDILRQSIPAVLNQ